MAAASEDFRAGSAIFTAFIAAAADFHFAHRVIESRRLSG